jgi:hypothetical protein
LKREILLAILTVIVIAGGIGGYLAFQKPGTEPTQTTETPQPTPTPETKYAEVTIRAITQDNISINANVTIGDKNGVTPWVIYLNYGKYTIVAKYRDRVVEKVAEINQSTQEIVIVFETPKPEIIGMHAKEFNEKLWEGMLESGNYTITGVVLPGSDDSTTGAIFLGPAYQGKKIVVCFFDPSQEEVKLEVGDWITIELEYRADRGYNSGIYGDYYGVSIRNCKLVKVWEG